MNHDSCRCTCMHKERIWLDWLSVQPGKSSFSPKQQNVCHVCELRKSHNINGRNGTNKMSAFENSIYFESWQINERDQIIVMNTGSHLFDLAVFF